MLGSVPQYKTEEYMKSKLSSEEDEVNQVIKAEYLKNSSVENITVSAPIFLSISARTVSQIVSALIKRRQFA